jgi:hypothetical protein
MWQPSRGRADGRAMPGNWRSAASTHLPIQQRQPDRGQLRPQIPLFAKNLAASGLVPSASPPRRARQSRRPARPRPSIKRAGRRAPPHRPSTASRAAGSAPPQLSETGHFESEIANHPYSRARAGVSEVAKLAPSQDHRRDRHARTKCLLRGKTAKRRHRLENRCRPSVDRGFESLPLRFPGRKRGRRETTPCRAVNYSIMR